MVIRPAKREDISQIDAIYKKDHEDAFSLPGLKNHITHAVIEKDDKIIGFGVVKVYAEAVMILDLDQSKTNRLEALDKLMQEAIRGCQEAGIEQLHVSVTDTSLGYLLQKHYDFKPVSGHVLFRELK